MDLQAFSSPAGSTPLQNSCHGGRPPWRPWLSPVVSQYFDTKFTIAFQWLCYGQVKCPFQRSLTTRTSLLMPRLSPGSGDMAALLGPHGSRAEFLLLPSVARASLALPSASFLFSGCSDLPTSLAAVPRSRHSMLGTAAQNNRSSPF